MPAYQECVYPILSLPPQFLRASDATNIDETNVVTQYAQGSDDVIVLPRGTDGPLRTLYGTVWSTSCSGQAAGCSLADSAFGCEALPLHTDMTYSRDPPGLQIFTMVQPAVTGGESIYCDGFAAADRLRRTNPDAFDFLSKTVRRFYCVDKETGWHMEASGPIIAVEKGEIVQVRHNDLDRMPDLPPEWDCADDKVDEFYARLQSAHAAWDSVLAEDDMRLVVGLQPGDTVVVANQVCRQRLRMCIERLAISCSDSSPFIALASWSLWI
jgi:Taurine catabolism dioxygenase TauD, TfdA family